MTILKLIDANDKILTTKAKVVEDVNSIEIKTLIEDLIETSIEIGGYGLAAPQVGIDKQLFVYRKTSLGGDYKVVINPTVIVSAEKMVSRNEGCLSLPGFRRDMKRSKTFVISCINASGEVVRLKGSTKIETLILQHEVDHLFGKLIRAEEV